MTPNATPKTRFMLSGLHVSDHRRMTGSEEFERGTDAAMLQYQILIANQIADGNSAMAAGFKLQGALEYLQTLKLIAESPRAPQPTIVDNLDPKN